MPKSPEIPILGCIASNKERRKCQETVACHTNCNGCPYWKSQVAEIPLNTRGGETMEESREWRKHKLRFGIPHGDD